VKTIRSGDAQRAHEAVQQRHYANRTGWLGAGDWCDRRVAFAELGRRLSTGRRRVEEGSLARADHPLSAQEA
jgi:hypothetical protein